MAAALTYASLLADLSAYAERTDQAFIDQRDRFIMLAENRIASEARGLGLIQSVTGDMVTGVGGSRLAKPARWRESVSLSIGTGTPPNLTTAPLQYRQALKLRGYEYCRMYWPDSSQTDVPLYYADWNWQNFLVVPSPIVAFPYELLFFERPQPLDNANQTNWTTQFAPQLILFACLLEASAWVKNKSLIDTWEAGFNRALKQVEFESAQRIADRAQSNPK